MNINNLFKKRKEITDNILNPLIKILIKLKISANLISILSALILMTTAYFIFTNKFKISITLIIISIILDITDGALARKYKPKEYGALFDSSLDYSFNTLIIIAFYSINLISFNTTIFSIGSIFFFSIIFNQFFLYKKKYILLFPIGMRYFYILFLIFPNFNLINNFLQIIGLINFTQSLFLLNKI